MGEEEVLAKKCKHKILVIDDNEWIRDNLKQLLAMSGYKLMLPKMAKLVLKK